MAAGEGKQILCRGVPTSFKQFEWRKFSHLRFATAEEALPHTNCINHLIHAKAHQPGSHKPGIGFAMSNYSIPK